MKPHIQVICEEAIRYSDDILGPKHFTLNPDVFTIKPGSIVTHEESKIIGTLYGYMASPFNGGDIRAILGVGCDVSMSMDLRSATKREIAAYLLYSKDFNPIPINMTALIG